MLRIDAEEAKLQESGYVNGTVSNRGVCVICSRCVCSPAWFYETDEGTGIYKGPYHQRCLPDISASVAP